MLLRFGQTFSSYFSLATLLRKNHRNCLSKQKRVAYEAVTRGSKYALRLPIRDVLTLFRRSTSEETKKCCSMRAVCWSLASFFSYEPGSY